MKSPLYSLNAIDYTNKSVIWLVAKIKIVWYCYGYEIARLCTIRHTSRGNYFPSYSPFLLTTEPSICFNWKKNKHKEVIIKPEDNVEVVSEHATVHRLTVEIPVFNWKDTCKENLKPTQSHFQISKFKRICIDRKNNKIKVRGEISYNNDTNVVKSTLKRGKKFIKMIRFPFRQVNLLSRQNW